VEALLIELKVALNLATEPVVSIGKDGIPTIFFASLRRYEFGSDSGLTCMRLAESLLTSTKKILDTRDNHRSQNWFELDEALICLEGKRILIVSLPLLYHQTHQYQLLGIKRVFKRIMPLTIPDNIFLKKVEKAASLEEIQHELTYFSKLGGLRSVNV
jgi:hypothetical protein